MLRYLPGILLVQIVTAVLLWVNLDATPKDLAIQFGVPAILITLVTGLWFASIARGDAERLNTKLRLEHARDREKIQLNAEKDKQHVMEKTHKEIRQSEKRISRAANFKVTAAFVAASAAGVLMLIIELFTFGLMTIMTTVGGMGGYLVRARQSYGANSTDLPAHDNVIDVEGPLAELPEPPEKLKTSTK